MKSQEWPGGSVGGVPRFNPANVARVEQSQKTDYRRWLESGNQFRVLAVDVPKGRDVDCGSYDTLDEARGCVEYDRIQYYEIWQGDRIVESNLPARR